MTRQEQINRLKQDWEDVVKELLRGNGDGVI